MIEIHHLHYIITTADLGSFSQAAIALRIKQSTLSQRVRHLEHKLGIALFDRSTRGAQLTRVGAQFLVGARQLVADFESLHRNAAIYGKGLQGFLRLGLSGAVPQKASQAILLDFARRYPEIQLSARVYPRQHLMRDLACGRLDAIMLAGHLAPRGASYREQGSERLYAVIGRENPMARQDALCWFDLRGHILLLPDGDMGDDLLVQISSRLAHIGDELHLIRRPLALEGIYQLLDARSVTIILESMLCDLPLGLAAIGLRDLHGYARMDYGLYWRAAHDNPALHSFLDFKIP